MFDLVLLSGILAWFTLFIMSAIFRRGREEALAIGVVYFFMAMIATLARWVLGATL